MKVALVHNPSAGDGDLKAGELRRMIEARGHLVEEFEKESKDVRRAIESTPDILAIAGGDGTVARALAVCFRERYTAPIALLPVGTANNIARSLGMDRPVEALVRTLPDMKPCRLDIGRITGPWGDELFVEAAGTGFVGTMIRHPMSAVGMLRSAIRGKLTGTDIDERIAQGLARIIREEQVRRATVIIDGKDMTGEFIAIEAMNIREVGPNIRLAPDADPSDGMLDVALVRPRDRDAIADAVERRATATTTLSHTVIRARRVEVSWEPAVSHVDDAGWPDSEAAGVATISIAGGVAVLRI
jgi:diacylglycerol kinase family enzyme